MKLFKFHKVLQKLLLCSFLLSSIAAAESGRLETINVGDNPLIELPGEKKAGAQVRIPIELRPYEKILSHKPGSELKQIEYRVIKPLRHVLRARIERTNHFYFDDWHIESVPVRWSKAERTLEVNLRIYKQYGESKELEEFIGSLKVAGVLQGENGTYTLSSNASQRYHNKHGQPIVELNVGQKEEGALGNLARQPSRKPAAHN